MRVFGRRKTPEPRLPKPKEIDGFRVNDIQVNIFECHTPRGSQAFFELFRDRPTAPGASSGKSKVALSIDQMEKLLAKSTAVLEGSHREGQWVPPERDRHWLVLEGLELTRDGRILARASGVYPTSTQAQLAAQGTSKFAWPLPQDFKPQVGQHISLSVPENEPILALKKRELTFQQETGGEFITFGRLFVRDRVPEVGEQVRFIPSSSLDDHRIVPLGRSTERGEPSIPIFVAIDRKTETVVAVSEDRDHMVRTTRGLEERAQGVKTATTQKLFEKVDFQPELRQHSEPIAKIRPIQVGNTRAQLIERPDGQGRVQQSLILLNRSIRDVDGRDRYVFALDEFKTIARAILDERRTRRELRESPQVAAEVSRPNVPEGPAYEKPADRVPPTEKRRQFVVCVWHGAEPPKKDELVTSRDGRAIPLNGPSREREPERPQYALLERCPSEEGHPADTFRLRGATKDKAYALERAEQREREFQAGATPPQSKPQLAQEPVQPNAELQAQPQPVQGPGRVQLSGTLASTDWLPPEKDRRYVVVPWYGTKPPEPTQFATLSDDGQKAQPIKGQSFDHEPRHPRYVLLQRCPSRDGRPVNIFRVYAVNKDHQYLSEKALGKEQDFRANPEAERRRIEKVHEARMRRLEQERDTSLGL